MAMHGGHELVEMVAALVLTVGGAAILVRAWLIGGRGDRSAAGGPVSDDRPVTSRRSADGLVVVLSGAGAAIHLAAGPEHVEALGDVGLGFYWAALLQGGWAVAWVLAGRSTRLAVFGIVLNAVLIAAWAWSRTIGVGLPGGPEGIGVADGVTVALEVALIAVLATALSTRTRPAAVWKRVPAASAAIAIGGVAVLATTIALVDIGGVGGHGHGHGHEVGTSDTAHAVAP